MKKFILIIALVITCQNNVLAASTESSSSQNNKVPEPSSSNNYKCDGRAYCSQMTSCEEATFFINNCPNTKMDGGRDGEQPDGVPCEKQWCN